MRGKANAVKQAKRLLAQLGITPIKFNYSKKNGCEVDVTDIAKCLNINIVYDSLPDNISGVFIIKDKKLALGVNEGHSQTRQRFTIAHEIGHYLLHSNETLHYDKNTTDSEIFFRSDVSSLNEIEANHFAAELLMPRDAIEKGINEGITSTTVLADLFHVSEDAMKYRLINLGYL